MAFQRHKVSAVFALASGIVELFLVAVVGEPDAGDVASQPAPVLACEVCQVLCIMSQEALEDLQPKTRLDTTSAASKVVSAAQGKSGPCKVTSAWEPTAKKMALPIEKVQLSCRHELERTEESMEAALGDPALRDEALRQRVCLKGKKQKDGVCEAVWPQSEVPMSKKTALKLKEKEDEKQEAASKVREQEAKANEKKSKAFFKANKGRAGIQALPSGLQIKVLHTGDGAVPADPHQRVTVHYRGMNIDCAPQDGPVLCSGGTEFDSTYTCKEGTPSAERSACEKNSPISFTAHQAGTFWLELLPRMAVGTRVEAYVPYKLAYGSTDDPNHRPDKVGPRAALIFQVELIKVEEKKPSEKDKAGFTAIAGVKTTFKTLTQGEGAAVVEVGDTVTVHATGTVQKTGTKFWSTKDPGQEPFTYTAGGGVIAGWDMGGRGMKKGEVRMLKIPANEGYGAAGFPAWGIPPNGGLDFELEVLNLKKKGATEL